MKKILIFSLAYYPHVGGAEVAIKEITDRIGDIEWHLLTLRFDAQKSAEEKIGNVFVHRVGNGSSYFQKMLFVPRAAFAAKKLDQELSFDALWAMMTYMLLPIVFARLFGLKRPYALTLQDGDPYERVFARVRILPFVPMLKWGFRHASAVSAISHYLAAWAARMGYQGPVEIIPNGVDVAYFSQQYPPAAIDEVKDALGKKMGDVFLITTSRLVHKNAIDDVLRALPLLPENVHFVVLGSGLDEIKLKKLAKKLGVESRTQFLGHIDRAEMPKYLQAADIFVRPSRSEGMGASFVEAMAAGLPVVATQEGGIADFLFDEACNPGAPVTGYAVDKNSPAQIAEAVKKIMNNQEKMRAVVRTAKQMVADKYDWALLANDMREKVFAQLLLL